MTQPLRTPAARAEDGGTLALVLLAAVWFALLASLIEVAILAVRRLWLHEVLVISPHIVWMAPVTNVVALVAVGLLTYPLLRVWPPVLALRAVALPGNRRPVRARLVVTRRGVLLTLLAFVALLAPLLDVPRLDPRAVALLAAGLAIRAVSAAEAHPAAFRRLARRTVWWLVALVLSMGAGVYGWQGVSERRALLQLPAPPSKAFNVLLIILDTVRAKSLSLYGYHRHTTPHLERLARDGVVFDGAVATAPWTLPSHASMFTGRYP